MKILRQSDNLVILCDESRFERTTNLHLRDGVGYTALAHQPIYQYGTLDTIRIEILHYSHNIVALPAIPLWHIREQGQPLLVNNKGEGLKLLVTAELRLWNPISTTISRSI